MKALALLENFVYQIGFLNSRRVQKICPLVLLTLLFVEIQSQKLTVIPVDSDGQFNLSSTQFDYQKENLDIIWNISYPAEIKISEFDVDSLSGDFIVICQYPLPNDGRLSTGAAIEDLVHLLPVEDSILLSTELFPTISDDDDDYDDEPEEERKDVVIRIVSPYGGFIYFHRVISEDVEIKSNVFAGEHGTKNISSLNSSQQKVIHTFKGFHISLNFYEMNPTTIPPSTTERLTTPRPGVGIYIWKHVVGKTPGDFYKDLALFKEAIALMANAYCDDKKDCNLPRPIVSTNVTDDVRLTMEMIFFCERSLSYYSTCVQVQFAITIRDIFGNYVMISERLEEMWAGYAQKFLSNSLQPIEPPAPEQEMTTWVWVAAALGSILALSTILCFALVGNNVFKTNSSERHEGEINKTMGYRPHTNQSRDSTSHTLGDRGNPIFKIIQNMELKHDEEMYRMQELQFTQRRDFLSLNQLLSEHQGHSNQTYIPDDEEDEVHYNSQIRGDLGSRHTFPAPMHPDYSDDDSDQAIEVHNRFDYHSQNH